jgi:hypothetical protein
MRSVSRWSRFTAAMILAAVGMVACEDEDKVVAPINDTVPPAVSITSVSHSAEALSVSVRAEDYISVAYIVTEICCDDQGKAISDTTYYVGRTTTASVTTVFTFWEPITQNTAVEVRGIGVDSSGNRTERVTPYLITVP